MDKKSKGIPGLKRLFSEQEKHQIIEDYLTSGSTKNAIWKKYTGHDIEHGHLLRWMRELGYGISITTRRPNLVSRTDLEMAKKKKPDRSSTEDFDTLQLQNRIAELEARLKDAEMKAITYSTMIEIAERELNISIRKKYNTKSLKK